MRSGTPRLAARLGDPFGSILSKVPGSITGNFPLDCCWVDGPMVCRAPCRYNIY